MGLHGNIYDLGNGYLFGKVWNQLPQEGMTLDGHYTIIWNPTTKDLKVYKHADYGSLTYVFDCSFEVFLKLNEMERNYIQSIIDNTNIQFYKDREDKQCGTNWCFEYDFELHGKPEFYDALLNPTKQITPNV